MKHTHEELRALCDAATGGEWRFVENKDQPFYTIETKGERVWHHKCVISNNNCINDGRFIAATDPPTVRALLDEIERLKCERGIETQLTLGERKKIIGDIFKDGWTVNDLTKCEAFYNSVQRYLKERQDDE